MTADGSILVAGGDQNSCQPCQTSAETAIGVLNPATNAYALTELKTTKFDASGNPVADHAQPDGRYPGGDDQDVVDCETSGYRGGLRARLRPLREAVHGQLHLRPDRNGFYLGDDGFNWFTFTRV